MDLCPDKVVDTPRARPRLACPSPSLWSDWQCARDEGQTALRVRMDWARLAGAALRISERLLGVIGLTSTLAGHLVSQRPLCAAHAARLPLYRSAVYCIVHLIGRSAAAVRSEVDRPASRAAEVAGILYECSSTSGSLDHHGRPSRSARVEPDCRSAGPAGCGGARPAGHAGLAASRV